MDEVKVKRLIVDVLHWIIIILSGMLIVFISVDTFNGINFLDNQRYMRFQLWTCIVFIADFFIELFLVDDRRHYLRTRWLFFLLSIPYLTIVHSLNLALTPEQLFYLRFIPLARGVLAMVIVVGAISQTKITSFLTSYLIIMAASIYLGSLIFLYREHPVNPMVNDFGSALWWACMTATTLGCDINPVTVTGKILGCVLSVGGIIMFPLFTVYITSLIQHYKDTHMLDLSVLKEKPDQKSEKTNEKS